MPVSQLDPKLTYDTQQWVVSLVNISNLIQHAMLIVEGEISTSPGMMATELFIGQYDIQALAIEEPSSSLKSLENIQGIISEIRVFEDNKYGRNYSKYQSRSIPVTFTEAQRMITNIKEEKAAVETSIQQLQEFIMGEQTVGPITLHRYQQAGIHRLGSQYKAHNCVTWCEEKLAIAGVENTSKFLDGLFAVPSFHAKTSKMSCVLL